MVLAVCLHWHIQCKGIVSSSGTVCLHWHIHFEGVFQPTVTCHVVLCQLLFLLQRRMHRCRSTVNCHDLKMDTTLWYEHFFWFRIRCICRVLISLVGIGLDCSILEIPLPLIWFIHNFPLTKSLSSNNLILKQPTECYMPYIQSSCSVMC